VSTTPPHIPTALVRDFDMSNCTRADGDIYEFWKDLQNTGPAVFWTPRYGGHWVATQSADIRAMQQDTTHFSNAEIAIPTGVQPTLVPLNLDPPAHGAYRRLLNPFFAPKALARIEERARAQAIGLIEQLSARGECEFVGDFAGIMPIVVFLSMMELPQDDLPYLRACGHDIIKPHLPAAIVAWENLQSYIRKWIEIRRRDPGSDPLSATIHAQIDGRRLTDQEVLSMCLLLLAGGLDSVASTLSFIAHFLATHPEHYRQLREDPSLVAAAGNELVRRFGTSNLARVVREDMEYRGVRFKAGDMVLLPFPLYGLDEAIADNPMEVDFRRSSPRHSTFGLGPHTCPGRLLAQREIAIFLEEWPRRISSMSLAEGTVPRFSTGFINSVENLRLSLRSSQ
jgi:cytochrome P450